MKTYIVMLSFFFLWSCENTQKKKDTSEFDYLLISEYYNEYDVFGKLVKTIITKSEAYNNYNNISQISKFESIYEYSDNKLTKRNEFEVDNTGSKVLQHTTNYTNNVEEEITWDGTDTISYQKRQYDSSERLTYLIKKTNFSAPDFDFEIADNFEERIVYDKKGNIIERTIIDYLSGKSRKEHFFYDSIPPTFSYRDSHIVFYKTIKNGDTIKTERYYNGELDEITLTVNKKAVTKEFTYMPNNVLILSQEILELGDKRIEVTNIPKLHTIDSLFYSNNKEIKSVLISKEQRNTTLTEYDEHGNILSQKEYIVFLKNDL